MPPSPSTRRSPRSEKLRGLHPAPPSKKAVVAAAAPSREEDASAASAASDATTTTAAAKDPPLPPPASTTGRRGGKIGLPGDPKGAPLLVSPWRKTTFISPRTRGAAIVGALSSPGDFLLATTNDGDDCDGGAGGRGGGDAAFLSPSRRSSAEAALHYLARETAKGGGGNDDGGDRPASLALRNGRRRRKAASDANDRLRDICDLDEFDDLDRLLGEDKIPYNKPAAARRGRGAGGKDAVTKTTTGDVATVGSFVTRGKNDERWLRNFQMWTTSKGGGGSTTTSDERSFAIPPGALSPPSSTLLPKGWVRDQRAQYRALTRGERSAMTRDRVALLEGAGFVWEARNGRGGASLADDGKLHDVQSGDAGRTAATVHVTAGRKHERKDGEMGKRAKSEATRGTSSPDVIEDNAQRSDARGTSTTVQHAKEGQSERKHGRIRNSAKSRPTTQSAGGDPGRSIINGGSPGRKSPRKSPPTQFYHSLLLGTRSEVGGGSSSGDRSSDPTISNDEGRSSRMIPDPGVSSDRASPTAASKKRKRSSPSKRTSPSFKEGSLTSLPPSDVVAEDGSDKRGERRKKKKRRRGRHSTSSLFALEPPVEASTEGGGKVDSVRKGPAVSFLSHRELEEVLSKSRKSRSRKKSGGGAPKRKIPVEPTTSIAGAVPIDANKSSSEDSKLVDEPSRGEVGAEIEASKGGHNASLESPLRVTRLLPALMGIYAVDGTIGATAVSYMTGEGSTDVPCIAQLLLSCLSEDSAEKAAHSSALSGPKSMTDEVASVNVVSCEMNRDGPGGSPSLPFTSKPPEESISRLDPSSDNGTSAAQIESSKSESKQQNIARPKPYVRNSKPPKDFLTSNSTSGDMPHRKKKTKKVESSKQTKVPFEYSRRGASTNNSNAGVDEMRLVDTTVAPKKESGINPSHKPEDSVGRLANCTIWTCDICKAATFDDYFDAMAHEEECAIANKAQEKTPSNKRGEEESNVSGDRSRRKSSLIETEKFQAIAAAKAPRESRRDPSSDKSHDVTCAAQVESSWSESKHSKYARPETSAMNSMPPEESIASHSTNCDLPIWKKKTKGLEPSKEKEVPLVSSLRGTSTKSSNPGMEKLNQVILSAARGVKPSLLKQPEPIGHFANSTTWTCDKSQEAAFENHDDAVTHKENCAAAKNSNAEANEMNRADTTVAPKKESGINPSHKPEDSVGRLANCTIWTCDICKAATFDDYFDAVAHEEECAIANKAQEKTPSNKRGEEELYVSGDRLRRKSSLIETEKFQAIAAAKAPRESRRDPSSDKSHDVTCAAQVEYNLVPNGVVFQNGILNYSFPAGEQIRESQLQMIIPESGYLERMTELGRLQLETQVVTRRMQQIEDMMKLSSKMISHVGDIEGCGSMSRKRSYLKESNSTSIHHRTHSWSCHNESSNEEYSDSFHSPRKMRRQMRARDELESRMLSSRRLEIHKGSPKTMNGRSTSSRHGGTMTHLRYDDSDIETRRSQISKKVERYGAARSHSPKRHGNRVDEMHHAPRTKKSAEMYHAPRNKKTWKSSSTEPLVARVPSMSGSRKTKSKQMLRSDVEKLSPRELASHQSDEHYREESRLRTVPSPSKSQKRSENKSESPPIKTSTKPNVEAGAKYSDKASSEQSPVEAKGKDVIPARSSQYQVNETRDPIYWLAGGESSSDDESWDFDGPMILPPSPI